MRMQKERMAVDVSCVSGASLGLVLFPSVSQLSTFNKERSQLQMICRSLQRCGIKRKRTIWINRGNLSSAEARWLARSSFGTGTTMRLAPLDFCTLMRILSPDPISNSPFKWGRWFPRYNSRSCSRIWDDSTRLLDSTRLTRLDSQAMSGTFSV